MPGEAPDGLLTVPPNFGRLNDWVPSRMAPIAGNLWIKFEACGASTAKVGVAAECRESAKCYTFCAGANENVNGVIKRSDTPVARVFHRLLDSDRYHTFWIQICAGRMAMGTGTELGQKVVVAHVDKQPFAVKYVCFTSGHDTVKYRAIQIGSNCEQPGGVRQPFARACAA